MRRARALAVLTVFHACVAATFALPARADDDAYADVSAAITEARRKVEAKEYRAAFERLIAVVERVRSAPIAIRNDYGRARLVCQVNGAVAYGAGEDADLYSPEQKARARKPSGETDYLAMGRVLFDRTLHSLREVSDESMQQAILADELLAPLHRASRFRMIRWSEWRQGREIVWGDVRLETGDELFERTFAEMADVRAPDPNYEPEPVHRYLEAAQGKVRSPADAWTFRIRCALLNPVNQGGWPTRFALLYDEDAARAARAELEERFGADPSPFERVCLVNLALACGDFAATRRLLDSLASGPQFLHDFALNHAEQLGARMDLANGEHKDPELKRFLDDVTAVYCGLAPALGTGEPAAPNEKGGSDRR